jgi:hypothetical protein
VSGGAGPGAGIGALIERAAQDARRHDVDPRELAALLYAHFEGARPGPVVEDPDARRALRAEIEALEHELTALEPLAPDAPARAASSAASGARLVTLGELEATRDGLARRVGERRRELREARAAARRRGAAVPAVSESGSAWPELLAVRPRPAT